MTSPTISLVQRVARPRNLPFVAALIAGGLVLACSGRSFNSGQTDVDGDPLSGDPAGAAGGASSMPTTLGPSGTAGTSSTPGTRPSMPTSGSSGAPSIAPVGNCYSPTQNTSNAYDAGSMGCPCDDATEGVCVHGIALVCEGGHWLAVEDGPCWVVPSRPVDSCPPYASALRDGSDCPDGYECFDWDGVTCAGQVFTEEECTAAGGDSVYDPGDGSLMRNGCQQADTLGLVIPGGIEGALCCSVAVPDPACTEDSDCMPRACGGFLGDTCAPEEYCAYEPGQLCGGTDASSVCKPRPEACLEQYAPVCGCDGKTYGSACAAASARTGVLMRGECGN